MVLPLFGCSDRATSEQFRRRHQERKLQTLTFWRDGLERQLAALNAAISTLEQQMNRSADA
jgi:hypothetical protein